MAQKTKRRSRSGLWRGIILIIIAVAVWWTERERSVDSRTQRSENLTSAGGVSSIAPSNELERLENVRWVEDRGNDGDSFIVSVGGERLHLRLYYVDAPEKYLSDRHESQRKRVGYQAKDLGGISLDQTVDLGNRARAHVADLLRGRPFTVYTKFEPVYDSERRYGFVELPGSDELLSEELVEAGLARIYTQGTITPDGKSVSAYKAHLRGIEREAQRAGRGAWGL